MYGTHNLRAEVLTCSLCKGVTPTEDGTSVVYGEILGMRTWLPPLVMAAPQRPEQSRASRPPQHSDFHRLTTQESHDAQQTLGQPR